MFLPFRILEIYKGVIHYRWIRIEDMSAYMLVVEKLLAKKRNTEQGGREREQTETRGRKKGWPLYKQIRVSDQ